MCLISHHVYKTKQYWGSLLLNISQLVEWQLTHDWRIWSHLTWSMKHHDSLGFFHLHSQFFKLLQHDGSDIHKFGSWLLKPKELGIYVSMVNNLLLGCCMYVLGRSWSWGMQVNNNLLTGCRFHFYTCCLAKHKASACCSNAASTRSVAARAASIADCAFARSSSIILLASSDA